jgi:hypothetical protein
MPQNSTRGESGEKQRKQYENAETGCSGVGTQRLGKLLRETGRA